MAQPLNRFMCHFFEPLHGEHPHFEWSITRKIFTPVATNARIAPDIPWGIAPLRADSRQLEVRSRESGSNRRLVGGAAGNQLLI
jgi:hypothetical protein